MIDTLSSGIHCELRTLCGILRCCSKCFYVPRRCSVGRGGSCRGWVPMKFSFRQVSFPTSRFSAEVSIPLPRTLTFRDGPPPCLQPQAPCPPPTMLQCSPFFKVGFGPHLTPPSWCLSPMGFFRTAALSPTNGHMMSSVPGDSSRGALAPLPGRWRQRSCLTSRDSSPRVLGPRVPSLEQVPLHDTSAF